MINSRPAEYFEKWKIATKIYGLDLLGGKCVRCGEIRIFALEFDHIKPTRLALKQRFAGVHISQQIFQGKEDLSNLQILCASCHSIKTYYEGYSIKKRITRDKISK